MAQVDFVAVDVETANAWRHSICQIGVVGFREGEEVFAREWLVDPGEDFHPFNVALHGIDADRVRGAPRFGELHADLRAWLDDAIVVAHSPFDAGAMRDACTEAGCQSFTSRWVDTVRWSRKVWPDLPDHRLPTVAAHVGYAFQHHSALEDARAAGVVLAKIIAASGLTLDACVAGPPRQSSADYRASIARAGDGDGPLTGQCVVLTGEFSARKAELADLVHLAGGAVATGVNKATTILVIGARDGRFVAEKSGKQLRAEALAQQGQEIVFLTEAQLRELVA